MASESKISLAKDIRNNYLSNKKDLFVEKENTDPISINVGTNKNNVVDETTLRKVQKRTLDEARDVLSKTFGPMGSNTKIITGNNKESIQSMYSKDGLKVLKYLVNSGPIEASIIEELIEITRHVEHEVGDGTTSTVILSSLIFDHLLEIKEKYNIPPYQLIRLFKKQVENIKKAIIDNGKECTIEDIYDISMVSTNGNEEISSIIKEIYEEYGMNVDLSVGISNTTDNLVKVYDGLTITEGMSDPVFITNKPNGTSEIHKAKIYHFVDPIDDLSQISLFEAILAHNIYDPLENDETPIPTVITCPRLSKDLSATLKMLTNHLYQFDQQSAESAKPPILIITNVVASDELIMNDIANLCGCKDIKKYIDPKLYERDKEAGIAPLPENIDKFAGDAELVIADSHKTKFINPKHMHITDQNGDLVAEDRIYTAMVHFLETEIENAEATDNAANIGLLKKRLSALKANMVEFLVGGVTIADRDATKDLAEDAIKNCSSAAKYGVGNAANFEALRAALLNITENNYDRDDLDSDIARCIYNAYFEIAKILYGTVSTDNEDIENHIYYSIQADMPYDISSGTLPDIELPSNRVKCSIMLDVDIIDTLSKIITLMVTCNNVMLQSPQLNQY